MIGELIALRGWWRGNDAAAIDRLRLDHCGAPLVVHRMERLAGERHVAACIELSIEFKAAEIEALISRWAVLPLGNFPRPLAARRRGREAARAPARGRPRRGEVEGATPVSIQTAAAGPVAD
jgi:hypothetical protein